MNKITFIWDIKDGKITILKRDKFNEMIKSLPDGRYIVELIKKFRQRSLQQNKAKFGIAYKIIQGLLIESWGRFISIDEVHEFCKAPENGLIPLEYIERLKDEYINDDNNRLFNKDTGEIKMIPFRITTTKMTTTEEMEYYKNMQDFALEFFNAEIPDPDPNWKDNLNSK